jgi:hypothetical protein
MSNNDEVHLGGNVRYSEALGKIGRVAQEIEAGLSKAVLTVSGGALTVAVGLVLTGRFRFPSELLPSMALACALLALAVICIIVNWAISSTIAHLDTNYTRDIKEGKRQSKPSWRAWNLGLTVLINLGVVGCITGVGVLVWVALAAARIAAATAECGTA